MDRYHALSPHPGILPLHNIQRRCVCSGRVPGWGGLLIHESLLRVQPFHQPVDRAGHACGLELPRLLGHHRHVRRHHRHGRRADVLGCDGVDHAERSLLLHRRLCNHDPSMRGGACRGVSVHRGRSPPADVQRQHADCACQRHRGLFHQLRRHTDSAGSDQSSVYH